jgi:hypothetical protein
MRQSPRLRERHSDRLVHNAHCIVQPGETLSAPANVRAACQHARRLLI